jgi:hypothetical protein
VNKITRFCDVYCIQKSQSGGTVAYSLPTFGEGTAHIDGFKQTLSQELKIRKIEIACILDVDYRSVHKLHYIM